MKTLMDNTFVRSIMLDADWNVLGMDAATSAIFQEKFNFDPVLRRKNFKSLLSQHDELKFQIIERVISAGREYRNEVFLEMFEEDQTYYDALFKPILNYSKEVDGYVFYFFDLTGQITAKQQLQSYQEKLKSVHHFKNNIIDKLGTEIKTPLNALIDTTSKMFKKEASHASDDSQLIKDQQDSACKLMKTFDHIINSSIYEKDFYHVKDEVNLKSILEQVHEGAKSRAISKGLEFTFDNFDREMVVHADTIFLKQAFENLMDNAFKHTQEGNITVKTSVIDNHAVISLTDTGAGLEESVMNRILNPKEEEELSIEEDYNQRGLGLTFAIRYIRGIGGHLHADTEIGKGTTFTLALPVVEKDT